MIEKFKNNFSRLIGWTFFLAFSIVTLSVLFADGGIYSYNKNVPILSFLIGTLVAAGLFLIYRKLEKNKKQISRKKEIFIVSAAILLFFAIGLFTIAVLRVSPSWDVGHIYEAALSLANNGDLGGEYSYVSNFPFQAFLVGVFAIIIKCTSWLINPKLSLMLVNLLLILGTIIFFYLIIRKTLGAKKAIFSLSLFLLFSPILLYTVIFYTDTISMFFITGSVYLALLLFEEKISKIKLVILSVIFGLFCFCGYQVKATSIFILIATVIFALLIKKKINIKRFAISAVCVITVFVPLSLVVASYTHRITDRSLEVPKTHWIMQGLNGYGGFNMEDYTDITYPGLGDKEELSKRHIEEIKSRLGKYGPIGYVDFLSKKISFTWGDGTYFVGDKLRRNPAHPESLVYQIVSADGNYFTSYNIWMNGLQIMLLIGITIGAFLTRKDRSPMSLLKIALMGLFMFLLAWETRSRYLINYLPIMLILFIYSLDKIAQLKISVNKKHIK